MLKKLVKRVFAVQRTWYSITPRYYYNDSNEGYYPQSFFKKSYTRPYTIMTDTNVMSVNCVKGKFKQQQDYIALDRTGAILLEFIPLKPGSEGQRNQYDSRGKKNFSLTLKSAGELLKQNPYDLKAGQLKLEFKYFAQSLNEEKKLTIQKGPKDEKISFILTTQKQGNNSTFTVPVDVGDFIIIQELIRYSLPYMLGWHIMNSPRIAEEEFNSSTTERFDNDS